MKMSPGVGGIHGVLCRLRSESCDLRQLRHEAILWRRLATFAARSRSKDVHRLKILVYRPAHSENENRHGARRQS